MLFSMFDMNFTSVRFVGQRNLSLPVLGFLLVATFRTKYVIFQLADHVKLRCMRRDTKKISTNTRRNNVCVQLEETKQTRNFPKAFGVQRGPMAVEHPECRSKPCHQLWIASSPIFLGEVQINHPLRLPSTAGLLSSTILRARVTSPVACLQRESLDGFWQSKV